jgi:hypothetical protein
VGKIEKKIERVVRHFSFIRTSPGGTCKSTVHTQNNKVENDVVRPYLLGFFFFVKRQVRLLKPNYLSGKTNKTLKSRNENEARFTLPGYLVQPLAC